MRPHLFTEGDSVLLVGEGNFSFCMSLLNVRHSLMITATTLASDVQPLSTQNNIAYLADKGVRVLLGVDGTKLADHHILKNEKFSKILFNFPHCGGKMKINLNRQLLKEFCESASKLLDSQGQILITLCKGQGGTGADWPLRRWDDSWQVVEMAAHGDLILTAVEPFIMEEFPLYSCIGYRSRDVQFHTDGALVHIFSKADPPYPIMEIDQLLQYLCLQTISTKCGDIRCSYAYATKYRNNILKKNQSPSNFLYMCLKNFLSLQNEISVKNIPDDNIPIHIECLGGEFLCSVNGRDVQCTLRQSLLDVFDQVVQVCELFKADVFVLAGLVFNQLTQDFSCPPASNEILLLGKDVIQLCVDYLQHIIELLKRSDMHVALCSHESCSEDRVHGSVMKEVDVLNDVVLFQGTDSTLKYVIAQECLVRSMKNRICLIYLDKLAQVLFDLSNWRDIWAQGTRVEVQDQHPILKLASLYPVSYTFDINIAYDVPYKEDDLYNIIWQISGDIIRRIELMNCFTSSKGWHAMCYRITYQSSDKPLYRKRVIDIHDNILGRVLSVKLGVRIT